MGRESQVRTRVPNSIHLSLCYCLLC